MELRAKPFECLGCVLVGTSKTRWNQFSVPTMEYETGVLIETFIRKHCG